MAKKELCISVAGGGMLGIGPLAFMCRLEQDLGKKLCDLTSAFSGTSTGAIIAACLDEGMSALDIFELYRKNLKKIFTKYPWYKRLTPACPTYDNTNLKKLLKSNLKGKMKDWKKPIFIPTTYMNGESVEKVWDLGDRDLDKWFAVLTSTAAPTYFDVIVENGKSYCDGGMWANENSDILLAGQFRQGHTNIKILNFATGMKTPNEEKGNKTLLGWGEYIIGDWTARSSLSPIYECGAILGDGNVFNCRPTNNKKIKMDKTDDETINEVIQIWEDYYDTVKKDVLDFIKNR